VDAVSEQQTIAYFSMEIALDSRMPTYSGGLGVLAGDTVRAAADLHVPMVGVTLLHRKGYFRQEIAPDGSQREYSVVWAVQDHVQPMTPVVTVTIEGRPVALRAWRYVVRGQSGFEVPVLLLDAHLPENSEPDRSLTDHLYGGDGRYRLCQEAILGIGGVKMLDALGFAMLRRFHMNEGHASLLTLALLERAAQHNGRSAPIDVDVEAVRRQCVFTTHTPVAAGHDQFPLDLAQHVLGVRPEFAQWPDLFCWQGRLNMTYVALNMSRYINGVAKKHGEVSRAMFAGYEIDAITNGVHAATWVSDPFQSLFDRYVPGWRADNFSLRCAIALPKEEVWSAHQAAKRLLLQEVAWAAGVDMNPDLLTIGFARRATPYKRADLFFHDPERLANLATQVGGLQVVYAGKAHPQDRGGKDLIRRVLHARDQLRGRVAVVYLPDYDMRLGSLVTAGADIWLNTPEPPQEASGTSGMKAALNGVPSLSVLDGWWIEGHIEGVTGWSIGNGAFSAGRAADAASLYEKLEQRIMPQFYRDRDGFIDVMRQTIALNGSFFHTQRMLQEYVVKAYR
jgi:starch phosphorylase